MSRLSKSLYRVRSCRNRFEYSKTSGNFPPLVIIRLVQKFAWEIFNIISSDTALRIFHLGLWFSSSRDILFEGGGPLIAPWFLNIPKILKKRRAASLALITKMSCANLYANWSKNGGRRFPDVKHECYGKLSVKSVLKYTELGLCLQANIASVVLTYTTFSYIYRSKERRV